MLCGVARIVAAAPRVRLGWSLFGRLVQIWPPRRLGNSMKLAARLSRGFLTDLSCMNSRSIVLRAEARLIVLLIVIRTVWPGFMFSGIAVSGRKEREV